MANENKILSKQLFKKWWFWVIVVAILGVIGLATQDTSKTNETATNTDTSNTTQNVGTLPVLNKADFTDKEGLVVFKDLKTKGYAVTAKYVSEAVPATNQEFTEQFTSANVTSCQDRLGFDAYLVSDVTQDGDSVTIILDNTPNNNQTCPDGTTNDL